MEEITIKLEPVERTEAWLLWEIEDRVAQRVSPVFCSPSRTAAQREFQRVVEERKGRPGDFAAYVVGYYNKGELLTSGEEL